MRTLFNSRMISRIGALAMSAIFSLVATASLPVSAQHATVEPAVTFTESECEPDTLLVAVSPTASAGDLERTLAKLSLQKVREMRLGPITVLKLLTPAGKANELMRLAREERAFTAVQRNVIAESDLKLYVYPNDPQFGTQWHLARIKAMSAALFYPAGKERIAVLDSGCANVDELDGKLSTGADVVNGGGGNMDVQGHGTLVATTAAANTNNNNAGAGVAPNAQIYPIRIAYTKTVNGKVKAFTNEELVIAGIGKAIAEGIRIVNLSYGNKNQHKHYSNQLAHPVLHIVLSTYHMMGGLIFNSAGNNNALDMASKQPYLIEVSAIDANDLKASFSSWGNPIWFAAPGQDIYCTDRFGKETYAQGTSFAAPIVAACAAVIWGLNPKLSNAQVEAILIKSCSQPKGMPSGWNAFFGYGVPNLLKAAKLAAGK